MRVLYAIQGTGNGHISRAKEIVPALDKFADLDVLVSSGELDLDIPFNVNYKYRGLGFIFGKKGGIDFLKTFKRNNIFILCKEIKSCPVEKYDLVINDFEPVSAWACKLKGVRCISLSHQSSLLSKKVPRPDFKNLMSMLIIRHYAPSDQKFGFHFKSYDTNIYPPIIRREIRNLNPTTQDYYTVYLPAYSDQRIIDVLSEIKKTRWQVFSKFSKEKYKKGDIEVYPVNARAFEESLENCKGVMTGAGFETPAEALYLKKKVIVIPMKNQYEQHFNASSLKDFGVPVLKHLNKSYIKEIQHWVDSTQKIEISFPDDTIKIVRQLISKFSMEDSLHTHML